MLHPKIDFGIRANSKPVSNTREPSIPARALGVLAPLRDPLLPPASETPQPVYFLIFKRITVIAP